MDKKNPEQRRPDQGQPPKKRPDQQGGNRPEDRRKERDDGTE
jgi:hypothetical protein